MGSATLSARPEPSTVSATVRLFLHRFGGNAAKAYRSAERALLAADVDDVQRWSMVCNAIASKAVRR